MKDLKKKKNMSEKYLILEPRDFSRHKTAKEKNLMYMTL